MNKYLIIAIIILAPCLIALGFNTLDWITQVPGQPSTWYFIYHSPWLSMPFWWAYMLGGLVPLVSGGILIGVLIGYILKRRKRRVVTA